MVQQITFMLTVKRLKCDLKNQKLYPVHPCIIRGCYTYCISHKNIKLFYVFDLVLTNKSVCSYL